MWTTILSALLPAILPIAFGGHPQHAPEAHEVLADAHNLAASPAPAPASAAADAHAQKLQAILLRALTLSSKARDVGTAANPGVPDLAELVAQLVKAATGHAPAGE